VKRCGEGASRGVVLGGSKESLLSKTHIWDAVLGSCASHFTLWSFDLELHTRRTIRLRHTIQAYSWTGGRYLP
jgi:hypothetical protein